MRGASAYISRQAPLKVNQSVLRQATSDNVRVRVSLPRQRAYLMVGEQIAADSPISSGKAGHSTPSGNFSVLEKDPDHPENNRVVFPSTQPQAAPGGLVLTPACQVH